MIQHIFFHQNLVQLDSHVSLSAPLNSSVAPLQLKSCTIPQPHVSLSAPALNSCAAPLPIINLLPSVCTFQEFYWAGSELFCVEHYTLWKAHRTVLHLLQLRTLHYFLNQTEFQFGCLWSEYSSVT